MKKVNSSLWVLACSLWMLVSMVACSQDEQGSDHSNQAVLNRFEQNLKVAEIHSQGLDYVYNKLQGYGSSNFRSIEGGGIDDYASVIRDISIEYAKGISPLSERISKISSNSIILMVDNNIQKENSNYAQLRSVSEIQENSSQALGEVEFFLVTIDKEVREGLSVAEVKNIVTSILTRPRILSLSAQTQEILSITGAIYVDSYAYWSKNLDAWTAVIRSKETQPRSWWNQMKSAMKRVASDDAEAAGQAAILTFAAAASGIGAGGALGAISAAAVVGSAWGATARAL